MADIVFLADIKNRDFNSVLLPDTIIDITHELTNMISSYAIEKQQDGAYNAKVDNNRVTITGFFSDAGTFSSQEGRTTPVDDILEEDGDTRTRRIRAFESLKKYRDEKTFLDVVTGLNVYTDCLIQNINIKEDKTTEDVLSFTISFIQPRFSTVIESRDVVIIERKQDSAASPTFGEGTKKDLPEEERESLLRKTLDALGDTINTTDTTEGG